MGVNDVQNGYVVVVVVVVVVLVVVIVVVMLLVVVAQKECQLQKQKQQPQQQTTAAGESPNCHEKNLRCLPRLSSRTQASLATSWSNKYPTKHTRSARQLVTNEAFLTS